jgi:hypothetical protein
VKSKRMTGERESERGSKKERKSGWDKDREREKRKRKKGGRKGR